MLRSRDVRHRATARRTLEVTVGVTLGVTLELLLQGMVLCIKRRRGRGELTIKM